MADNPPDSSYGPMRCKVKKCQRMLKAVEKIEGDYGEWYCRKCENSRHMCAFTFETGWLNVPQLSKFAESRVPDVPPDFCNSAHESEAVALPEAPQEAATPEAPQAHEALAASTPKRTFPWNPHLQELYDFWAIIFLGPRHLLPLLPVEVFTSRFAAMKDDRFARCIEYESWAELDLPHSEIYDLLPYESRIKCVGLALEELGCFAQWRLDHWDSDIRDYPGSSVAKYSKSYLVNYVEIMLKSYAPAHCEELSHKLIAHYIDLATMESLWNLTYFPYDQNDESLNPGRSTFGGVACCLNILVFGAIGLETSDFVKQWFASGYELLQRVLNIGALGTQVLKNYKLRRIASGAKYVDVSYTNTMEVFDILSSGQLSQDEASQLQMPLSVLMKEQVKLRRRCTNAEMQKFIPCLSIVLRADAIIVMLDESTGKFHGFLFLRSHFARGGWQVLVAPGLWIYFDSHGYLRNTSLTMRTDYSNFDRVYAKLYELRPDGTPPPYKRDGICSLFVFSSSIDESMLDQLPEIIAGDPRDFIIPQASTKDNANEVLAQPISKSDEVNESQTQSSSKTGSTTHVGASDVSSQPSCECDVSPCQTHPSSGIGAAAQTGSKGEAIEAALVQIDVAAPVAQVVASAGTALSDELLSSSSLVQILPPRKRLRVDSVQTHTAASKPSRTDGKKKTRQKLFDLPPDARQDALDAVKIKYHPWAARHGRRPESWCVGKNGWQRFLFAAHSKVLYSTCGICRTLLENFMPGVKFEISVEAWRVATKDEPDDEQEECEELASMRQMVNQVIGTPALCEVSDDDDDVVVTMCDIKVKRERKRGLDAVVASTSCEEQPSTPTRLARVHPVTPEKEDPQVQATRVGQGQQDARHVKVNEGELVKYEARPLKVAKGEPVKTEGSVKQEGVVKMEGRVKQMTYGMYLEAHAEMQCMALPGPINKIEFPVYCRICQYLFDNSAPRCPKRSKEHIKNDFHQFYLKHGFRDSNYKKIGHMKTRMYKPEIEKKLNIVLPEATPIVVAGSSSSSQLGQQQIVPLERCRVIGPLKSKVKCGGYSTKFDMENCDPEVWLHCCTHRRSVVEYYSYGHVEPHGMHWKMEADFHVNIRAWTRKECCEMGMDDKFACEEETMNENGCDRCQAHAMAEWISTACSFCCTLDMPMLIDAHIRGFSAVVAWVCHMTSQDYWKNQNVRELADHAVRNGATIDDVIKYVESKMSRNFLGFSNKGPYARWKRTTLDIIAHASQYGRKATSNEIVSSLCSSVHAGKKINDIDKLLEEHASGASEALKGILISLRQRIEYDKRLGENSSMKGRQNQLTARQLESYRYAQFNIDRLSKNGLKALLGFPGRALSLQEHNLERFPNPLGALRFDRLTTNLIKLHALLRRPWDGQFVFWGAFSDESYVKSRRTAGRYEDGEAIFGGCYDEDPSKDQSVVMLSPELKEEDVETNPETEAKLMTVMLGKRLDCDVSFPFCAIPQNYCGMTKEFCLFMWGLLFKVGQFLVGFIMLCSGMDGLPQYNQVNYILLGKDGYDAPKETWPTIHRLPQVSRYFPYPGTSMRNVPSALHFPNLASVDMRHTYKATAWAPRTSCRNMKIGDLTISYTPHQATGMPPSLLAGSDRQSDEEAARTLLHCHVVDDSKARDLFDERSLSERTTFWMLGSIVLNILLSMVSCAWQAREMGVWTRTLLAMVAYYFLVMARNYRVYKDGKGFRRNWFAANTERMLEFAAAWMVVRGRLWLRNGSGKTPEDPVGNLGAFMPWQQLEIHCEFLFSALRAGYTNAQLTVMDFYHAMWRHMVKQQPKMEQHAAVPPETADGLDADAHWLKLDELARCIAARMFALCCKCMSPREAMKLLDMSIDFQLNDDRLHDTDEDDPAISVAFAAFIDGLAHDLPVPGMSTGEKSVDEASCEAPSDFHDLLHFTESFNMQDMSLDSVAVGEEGTSETKASGIAFLQEVSEDTTTSDINAIDKSVEIECLPSLQEVSAESEVVPSADIDDLVQLEIEYADDPFQRAANLERQQQEEARAAQHNEGEHADDFDDGYSVIERLWMLFFCAIPEMKSIIDLVDRAATVLQVSRQEEHMIKAITPKKKTDRKMSTAEKMKACKDKLKQTIRLRNACRSSGLAQKFQRLLSWKRMQRGVGWSTRKSRLQSWYDVAKHKMNNECKPKLQEIGLSGNDLDVPAAFFPCGLNPALADEFPHFRPCQALVVEIEPERFIATVVCDVWQQSLKKRGNTNKAAKFLTPFPCDPTETGKLRVYQLTEKKHPTNPDAMILKTTCFDETYLIEPDSVVCEFFPTKKVFSRTNASLCLVLPWEATQALKMAFLRPKNFIQTWVPRIKRDDGESEVTIEYTPETVELEEHMFTKRAAGKLAIGKAIKAICLDHVKRGSAFLQPDGETLTNAGLKPRDEDLKGKGGIGQLAPKGLYSRLLLLDDEKVKLSVVCDLAPLFFEKTVNLAGSEYSEKVFDMLLEACHSPVKFVKLVVCIVMGVQPPKVSRVLPIKVSKD